MRISTRQNIGQTRLTDQTDRTDWIARLEYRTEQTDAKDWTYGTDGTDMPESARQIEQTSQVSLSHQSNFWCMRIAQSLHAWVFHLV